MTALSTQRATRVVTMTSVELLGKAETVYQGGLACGDTSTGLVAKGFVSTTLVPLGKYIDNQTTGAGGTVNIEFFEEQKGQWYANSTAGGLIAATDAFSDCYIVDDQTVAKTSGTATRSVAGMILKVDALKGVLVMFKRL